MEEHQLARAEDLKLGEAIEIGTYTPSLEEIIGFAERWDPQAFHTDPDVARRGYFGEIIGSGLHSLAILQRLSVLNLLTRWDVIAGRSLRDVQFLSPLRADIEVRGRVTIDAIAFSHPERALVTTRGELYEAAGGAVILTKVTDAYVRRARA